VYLTKIGETGRDSLKILFRHVEAPAVHAQKG